MGRRFRFPVYLEDWQDFASGLGAGWWLGPPRRKTAAMRAQERADRRQREHDEAEMRMFAALYERIKERERANGG